MFLRLIAFCLALAPAMTAAQTISWAVPGSTTATFHNPYRWSAEADMIGRQIYETLILKGAGTDYTPVLAEGLMLDDGRVTVKLKQGVRFHGGGELEAEDVVFSLTRAGHDESNVRAHTAQFESVSAVGAYQVEIQYSSSFDRFLHALSQILIVDSNYYEDNSINIFEVDYLHPNGTGAFKVLDAIPGDYVRLERFGQYHTDVSHPYQEVIIHIINDPTARENSLISGEIDIIDDIDPSTVKVIERNSRVYVKHFETDWYFVAETNPASPKSSGNSNILISNQIQNALTNAMGMVDASQVPFRMMDDAHFPIDGQNVRTEGSSDRLPDPLTISCAYRDGFVGELCKTMGRGFQNDNISHDLETDPFYRDKADLTLRWRRLEQIRFPTGTIGADDKPVAIPIMAELRAVGLKDEVEVELGLGGIPLFSPYAAASDDDDGCDDGCPPSGACTQSTVQSRQQCCPPSGACAQ